MGKVVIRRRDAVRVEELKRRLDALQRPRSSDPADFEAACGVFRQVCAEIAELTENPEFRGGFEEMADFEASPAAGSSEGIRLALHWMAADKSATYEAAKLGIGQPEWWFRCWTAAENGGEL